MNKTAQVTIVLVRSLLKMGFFQGKIALVCDEYPSIELTCDGREAPGTDMLIEIFEDKVTFFQYGGKPLEEWDVEHLTERQLLLGIMTSGSITEALHRKSNKIMSMGPYFIILENGPIEKVKHECTFELSEEQCEAIFVKQQRE